MYIKIAQAALLAASLLGSPTQAGSDERHEVMTLDPSEFGLAIEVPQGFNLEPGDTALSVSFVSKDVRFSEDFQLDMKITNAKFPKTRATNKVYLARFSPSDQKRFRHIQAQIAKAETTDQHGKGTASFSVKGGCITTQNITRLPISTWMQTDAAEGYQTIIKNRDLFKVMDRSSREQLQQNLRRCH